MTNASMTFQVLGKLLTEESVELNSQKEIEQQFEQLLEAISTNLYPIINNSRFENKTKLIVEIKARLSEIELFLTQPQLSNKTIVLIEGEKNAVPKWFNDLHMKPFANLTKQNKNIPMILHFDKDTTIFSQNELGNRAPLDLVEFNHANRSLYKDKIELQNLITAYFAGASSPYEHIVFIYIPQYVNRSNSIYRLLRHISQVVLLIEPTDIQLRSFQMIEQNKAGFMQCTDNDKVPIGVTSIQFDQMSSLLLNLNVPLYTTAFVETFKNAFNEYFETVTKELVIQQQLVNGLSKDLVTVSDDKLEKNISSIRDKLRKQLRQEEATHKKVIAQLQDCLKKLTQLETDFYETILQSDPARKASKRVELLAAKLGILARDNENNTDYKMALARMKQWSSSYENLLKVYKQIKEGSSVDREIIAHLKTEKHLDSVQGRILLAGFKYSGNPEEYVRLKEYFAQSTIPSILYEMGLAADFINNKKDTEHYFKKAMELGHRDSAREYIKYVNKTDIDGLEKIANLLIPEASYLVGMYYLQNKKYAKGITFIKIAGSFEYIPALEELSEREFEHFLKIRKNSDGEFVQTVYSNAIKLNQFIAAKKPKNAANERLGKLYYWGDDHRRAEPLLSEIDNGECNFMCGKMYQYGNVFSQDLNKAKTYFKKSMNQGYRLAEIEHDKVCGWIRSNESRETYNSSRSYSPSSTISSSSSTRRSGCFLTTATCLALGKEDDCLEIIEYKKYRDERLRFDHDGRDLIMEYYRIAPLIVEQIDVQKNAKDIYLRIYNRFIKVGYDYLQTNDLENAKNTYIAMVKELCEEFHIIPFEVPVQQTI
ncbi:CFI-box-CTERM domain-containing protein [Paenisporosarcina sp.]|uniref:CFI-box-CTERM domain-containing protein n=1 Tax=Paenisporosarcina sp. TaxID=1932001 RepID=UPI003C74449A